MARAASPARRSLGVLFQIISWVWRADPRSFVALGALMIVEGLLPLGAAFLHASLLDALLRAALEANPEPAAPPWLWALVGAIAGTLLLQQLLAPLGDALRAVYQVRVASLVQILIARKSASLDLAFFEQPELQNQMANASNEAAVRPLMMVQQLFALLSLGTTLISSLAIVAAWQPSIGLLVVGVSSLNFGLQSRLSRRRVRARIELTPLRRRLQYFNFLLTTERPAKEIRLFNLGEYFLERIRYLSSELHGSEVRLARSGLAAAIAAQLLAAAVQVSAVVHLVRQVLRHTLTLGAFSFYLQAVHHLQASFMAAAELLAQLYEGRLFVDSLVGLLGLPSPIESSGAAQAGSPPADPPRHVPRIEFRRVSFRYPGCDRDVLTDVSFEIAPETTVALVGENGAGKTTIVKLLGGLYAPTSGAILLDGKDISTIGRVELRRLLGIILQDYLIYHLSVADNIGLGDVERIDDREAVAEAARRSGAQRVIDGLPGGFETVLGRFLEHGHELSGGQQQQIALARLWFRDAPVLVLDEPSAALDVKREREFFESLLRHRRTRSRSVLFISHRFASVRLADTILVMEGGRLVERGSHEELLLQQGIYASMVRAQTQILSPA